MSKLVKTFTAEELAELKAYDKMVDKGEDLYPLSAEQKKNARQATSTSTGVYTFTKRERKPNQDKRDIMAKLLEACAEIGCGATLRNEERELWFTYNEKTYKVVLSLPRSLD